MYHEAYAVMMRAFESDVLNFEGNSTITKTISLQAKPVQRPHPPIWYGAPDAGRGRLGRAQFASTWSRSAPRRGHARSADRYRKEWAALGRKPADLPMIGITRHVVVARDRRGGARRLRGAPIRAGATRSNSCGCAPTSRSRSTPIYPKDYRRARQLGHGIAGSPATVRAYMEKLQIGDRGQLRAVPDGVRRYDL